MIFDLHCDSLLADLKGSVTLDKLVKAKAAGQCFAVFINKARVKDQWAFFEEKRAVLLKALEENGGVSLTLTPGEAKNNLENKKVSAVLTLEDADLVGGSAEGFDRLYAEGVRMASLIWNYPNCIGYPNSDDPSSDALTLTDFGRTAVEKMNALGMIIDVSHLNRGGFWDVTEISKKPVAASHSCCDALRRHSRNLDDAQLRRLGETGGVVGINYYSRFLKEDGDMTQTEDILRHVTHAVNVAGIESVALGSDFDGIDTPVSFGGPEGYPELIAALEKRFAASQVELIAYKNFLRVWEAQS